MYRVWFGDAFRSDASAVFVHCLKVFAVQIYMLGMFALQHRIRAGASGDEYRACRDSGCRIVAAAFERYRAGAAMFVYFDTGRFEVFDDADIFLKGLFDFLVIEAVG